MAKKPVKVAYDTEGYDRVRLGKQEHVRKYLKQVTIPELSKKTEQKIKTGKPKRLPKKQEEIREFALLSYEFGTKPYSWETYDKELATKLNNYIGKYNWSIGLTSGEISSWVNHNIDHKYRKYGIKWWQEPILYYEGVYRGKIDMNDYLSKQLKADTSEDAEFLKEIHTLNKLVEKIIKEIKAER